MFATATLSFGQVDADWVCGLEGPRATAALGCLLRHSASMWAAPTGAGAHSNSEEFLLGRPRPSHCVTAVREGACGGYALADQRYKVT